MPREALQSQVLALGPATSSSGRPALDSGGISNVSVVQPASLPIEPVKPRKLRNFVLSILLGMFGGIGFAFLVEFFDDSIKSRQDVARRLGLPVLATFTEEERRTCT